MESQHRSKKEVVYNRLHQAIIQGEHQPGQRLIIDEIALQLGVSSIPVREALRQLEADGFVRIEPYVGASVTGISADSIVEVFGLLETMERICARAACLYMSQEEIENLELLVKKMDQSVQNPEYWVQLNKEFHLGICDYAHTGLVKDMMVKVLDHWDRLRGRFMQGVFSLRMSHAQAEHHQIMAALRSRNQDEAQHLLGMHNQNALQAYIAYLDDAGHLSIGVKKWA